MKTVRFLLFIILLWLLYPVAHVIHIFKHGDTDDLFNFSDLVSESCLMSFICIVIYGIYLIIKFSRRNFEVEIYEYKNISYEDFLILFFEEQKSCELEYGKYAIKLQASNGEYICNIFGSEGLVNQQAFQSKEEMLSAKIISGQTIKELWNEIEYQDTSGIIKY